MPGVPTPVTCTSECGVSVLVTTDAHWGYGNHCKARQLHRIGRQTRNVLPPNGSGCDSLRGSQWDRVAAAAGGVPAGVNGVRDLRPLGPRRGVAAIHDARRARLRVRAGRDRCPTAAIVDSQTVPAADTVPGSRRG